MSTSKIPILAFLVCLCLIAMLSHLQRIESNIFQRNKPAPRLTFSAESVGTIPLSQTALFIRNELGGSTAPMVPMFGLPAVPTPSPTSSSPFSIPFPSVPAQDPTAPYDTPFPFPSGTPSTPSVPAAMNPMAGSAPTPTFSPSVPSVMNPMAGSGPTPILTPSVPPAMNPVVGSAPIPAFSPSIPSVMNPMAATEPTPTLSPSLPPAMNPTVGSVPAPNAPQVNAPWWVPESLGPIPAPSTPTIIPSEIPNSIPTSVSTPSDATPSPLPSDPSSCPSAQPSPQPAVDIVCINGIWVYNTSVSISTITVGSPLLVNGNLTVSGTITIDGSLSSSMPLIESTHCITVNGGIEIQISASDINALPQSQSSPLHLLHQDGQNCPDAATSITVTAKSSAPSCNKVKVIVSPSSSPSDLNVFFDVSTIQCKLWWIILVSVLAALVLIALVVFVLLATYNDRVKGCLRPFWLRANRMKAFGENSTPTGRSKVSI